MVKLFSPIANQTSALKARRYVYDVELNDTANNTINRIFEETATVLPNIQDSSMKIEIKNSIYLKYDSNIIFIRPILDNLSYHFNKNLKILKCKYNLLTKSNNNNHHYPHSDLDDFKNNIFTAIYYINNTDGETYLFNEFAPKLNDEISVIKKQILKKKKF
jgi:hypothetical protein